MTKGILKGWSIMIILRCGGSKKWRNVLVPIRDSDYNIIGEEEYHGQKLN